MIYNYLCKPDDGWKDESNTVHDATEEKSNDVHHTTNDVENKCYQDVTYIVDLAKGNVNKVDQVATQGLKEKE